MAFKFSIRIVSSHGDPGKSVRVSVHDPRPIGLGGTSEYTDADGWANFEWPDGSSTGLDVYLDGDKEGYHVIEDGDTLSFTVDYFVTLGGTAVPMASLVMPSPSPSARQRETKPGRVFVDSCRNAMDEQPKRITVNGNTFHCNVDAIHLPTIERLLRGNTEADENLDALDVPSRPLWLFLVIRAIRWYRRRISPRLGSRCVFEPSCSHYAELAFRKRGFFRGLALIIHRLLRCHPGRGGVDLP